MRHAVLVLTSMQINAIKIIQMLILQLFFLCAFFEQHFACVFRRTFVVFCDRHAKLCLFWTMFARACLFKASNLGYHVVKNWLTQALSHCIVWPKLTRVIGFLSCHWPPSPPKTRVRGKQWHLCSLTLLCLVFCAPKSLPSPPQHEHSAPRRKVAVAVAP